VRPRGAGSRLAPGLEVIALLRRGTDLDVYDAWSDELGARCVVKTVRPDRRADRRARARLLREGRLLRRLSHPHLVHAHAVVREPWPLLVLEVLGGETLGRRLEQGPLDEDEAAVLGLHLGSALRYLHRAGIVHLDVKPSNVVLEGARARLLDLSIARPPGTIRAGVGTVGYLAPEQERGGPVGPPADVWGLAVTLGEAIGNGGCRRGALRELLAPALAPEPADRPPLERLLAGLEQVAGAPLELRRFG
jgi:eukaryotic-like serine/threonine-protein kinase